MKTELFLHHPTYLALGVPKVEGNLFGIELELEGKNVGLRDVATRGWGRHNEPSLRGESIEYHTTGGKPLAEAKSLVSTLFKKFKDNNVVFNNSIRTSTHVHLNFSDKQVKKFMNFFCLFTVFEELLSFYSGEDRHGNVFCLTTRESEGVLVDLQKSVETGSFNLFQQDFYKYGACNLSALCKFGTVEVRTMRGANSAEQVNNWLDILNDLYEYSLKMDSPVDVVRNLSYLGADGLLRAVFSAKNAGELLATLPKTKILHESLMEGVRLIQVFSYQFDEQFNAKIEPVKEEDMFLPMVKDNGGSYHVYRPDGSIWSCLSHRYNGENGRELLWQDDERCRDDNRIAWSAVNQRFVYHRELGPPDLLNWVDHEVLGNEGPPAVRKRLGGFPDHLDGVLIRNNQEGFPRAIMEPEDIEAIFNEDVNEDEEF